uniref:Uncharacterized protein n=1 Tax=Arundo donax TaxID=35708 RepID=A0A0A8ZB60_ARUDO
MISSNISGPIHNLLISLNLC